MQPNMSKYPDVMEKLMKAGLRPTRQRLLLGHLLFSQSHRHVTAESLYQEAQNAGVYVSLATVYNTLNQFTKATLLREVNVEGGRSYFDTNVSTHHHFLCEETGELIDIDGGQLSIGQMPEIPAGKQVSGVEIMIKLKTASA
jgi:Fur family iron response transcriptional regulator